mgnify:CR=1 FL=1
MVERLAALELFVVDGLGGDAYERVLSDAMAGVQPTEIRGFGSSSLLFRRPRMGRTSKSGHSVALAGKYVPHFKPGKDLRDRVNENRQLPIKD